MIWAVFLKFVYSSLLLFLTAILLRELYLVWLDDRLFIGDFEIIASAGGETMESTEFSRQIVAAQALMAQQLRNYEQASDLSSPTDSTFDLFPNHALSLPSEALKGVEITVQNINLTAIFTALRKSFTAPNEVSGSITSSPGSVLAAIDWPRAPVPLNSSTHNMRQFLVPNQSSLASAAGYIACSLSWARGAAQSDQLANVDRTQFCDFVSALNVLYSLNEKVHTPNGLSNEELAIIRRKIEVLGSLHPIAVRLPDILRLRADLLDLLPDEARLQSDLVAAQEDRLSYALLNPQLSALPEESRRYVAMALARPAIRIVGGEQVDAPENWRIILDRYKENVRRAANSTGAVFIRHHSEDGSLAVRDEHFGTAFVVAPGLALTATHIAKFLQPAKEGIPRKELVICFEDNVSECRNFLSVSRVIYAGKDLRLGVALLEVPGLNTVDHPTLALAQPENFEGRRIGSYAFVVGYPSVDGRLPHEYVRYLLATSSILKDRESIASSESILPGVKRLMPGRLLEFKSETETFTSDISTTGGTAGGAVVDLATGLVVGVSYAGQWLDGRGKFSYSNAIPIEVRTMIERRLSGIPIEEAAEEVDQSRSRSEPP